jgi:hypothetical protein
MDNFNTSNFPGNENPDKPIPLDDDTSKTKVSHSPLSLGGGSTTEVAKPVVEKPSVGKPAEKKASADRITSVKTFFTKLHPGAMEFLDEQIQKWLRENPGVHIKLTNTTTGEVQAKKTEPNIIISVWY